jgi:hypothetical protein
MLEPTTPSLIWTYAVEIKAEHAAIEIAVVRCKEYFQRVKVEHELVVEQRTRLIVKFTDETAARNFYYSLASFDTRFCVVPEPTAPVQ